MTAYSVKVERLQTWVLDVEANNEEIAKSLAREQSMKWPPDNDSEYCVVARKK